MSDTGTKQKQNLEFIFAFHAADPPLSKDLLIPNMRTVGRHKSLPILTR
jgi:hypothetical protein